MKHWIQSILLIFAVSISLTILQGMPSVHFLPEIDYTSSTINSIDDDTEDQQCPIDKEEEEEPSSEDEKNEETQKEEKLENKGKQFYTECSSPFSFAELLTPLLGTTSTSSIYHSPKLLEWKVPLYILFTCLKIDC